MRRLVVLLVAVMGLVLYLRLRLDRTGEPTYESPAEKLRSKLAESRAAEADAGVRPEPEPELESDLAVRRRAVHQRARSVIDDLS